MQNFLFFSSLILAITFIVAETVVVIRSRNKVDNEGLESSQIADTRPLALFIVPTVLFSWLLIRSLFDNQLLTDQGGRENYFYLLVTICSCYYFAANGIKAFLIKSK